MRCVALTVALREFCQVIGNLVLVSSFNLECLELEPRVFPRYSVRFKVKTRRKLKVETLKQIPWCPRVL